MAAGQMPREPGDAVAGRSRLGMEVLHGQSLQGMCEVMGNAQEEIQNQVLPHAHSSLCAIDAFLASGSGSARCTHRSLDDAAVPEADTTPRCMPTPRPHVSSAT